MNTHETARSPGPIFVLGHQRSGTTLLRYIIDTHPKICCPGELQLGELCEHLYRIMELTAGRVLIRDRELRHQQSIEKTRLIASQIMDAYSKAKDRPLWCEKSPGNLLHLNILQWVFPTARYICLFRHCMDVVSSCIEIWPPEAPVPAFLQFHYDQQDRDMVRTVIASWCNYTSRMIDLCEKNPESYFPMKFESLLTDPGHTLERMFEFLGVEWHEELLANIFSVNHQTGPGDLKLIASHGISKDRIGKGAAVSVDHVAANLLGRMNSLLSQQGYSKRNLPPAAEPMKTLPGAECVVTDVNELFGTYFPRQLEKYAARLTDLKGIVKFILTGEHGGTWTVNLGNKQHFFVSGDEPAECCFSVSSGDILNMVNQKLNPGAALINRRLRITGDVELAEEVAWALFGQ